MLSLEAGKNKIALDVKNVALKNDLKLAMKKGKVHHNYFLPNATIFINSFYNTSLSIKVHRIGTFLFFNRYVCITGATRVNVAIVKAKEKVSGENIAIKMM